MLLTRGMVSCLILSIPIIYIGKATLSDVDSPSRRAMSAQIHLFIHAFADSRPMMDWIGEIVRQGVPCMR